MSGCENEASVNGARATGSSVGWGTMNVAAAGSVIDAGPLDGAGTHAASTSASAATIGPPTAFLIGASKRKHGPHVQPGDRIRRNPACDSVPYLPLHVPSM